MSSTRPAALLPLLAVLLAGCSAANGTGVATNPPAPTLTAGPAESATPAPTGTQTSGVRTVLSPLGLNVRNGPAPTATRITAAARGAQLTVIGHSDQSGGWYQVQGATTTGWITGDPTLSAPGAFLMYSSSAHQFSALYPTGWTYSDTGAGVVFTPESGGQQSVVAQIGPPASVPAAGGTGYTETTNGSSVEVCGATGTLQDFTLQTGASPSPLAGAPPLAHRESIRISLDSAHVLALDYTYSDPQQIGDFNNFYNSMAFNFPMCEAPAPSASAAPSP